MEATYGGLGKTTFYKRTHFEYEEKSLDNENDFLSMLKYSNSDFREKNIDLLINVWFDFDQRKYKINYNDYPKVTLECHKQCICMLPVKFYYIKNNQIIEKKIKNYDLFPILGYKTTYWNNQNNEYLYLFNININIEGMK